MRRGIVTLRVSPLWDVTPEELRIRGLARAADAVRDARDRVLEDRWRFGARVRAALRNAEIASIEPRRLKVLP